jgi:hypothetical protein
VVERQGRLRLGGSDLIDLNGGSATGKDAVLAVGHHIAGHVSDGVNGLPGICVNVADANNEDHWVAGGGTDDSGDYSTQPVPDGDYKIQFEDCNPDANYIPEWWDDKPSWSAADPIVVSGSDVGGKDAVLTAGHKISGHVSDGRTGLPGICVGVTDASSEENELGGTQSDQDGDFTTPPLPDGQYKLRFDDCNPDPGFVAEWWNDKPYFDVADPITVSGSDATLGEDVVLAAGHTISGRVTSNGTDGIQNICVGVVQAGNADNWVGGGETDENGDYRTDVVLPGVYRLRFDDCNQNVLYVGEWFDDAVTFDAAADIDLTEASAAGIDAVLAVGGGISGTVRSGTGGGPPLAGICVNVERTDGPGGGGSGTDESGTYRAGGLPSGTYDVHFDDCRDDQSAGRYPSQTVRGVVVLAPDDTSGVDADMGSPVLPDTAITSGPSGSTSQTTADFEFTSPNVPEAGFLCRLDGADFQDCESPQHYNGLAEGEHTFEVKAIDPANNVDETPASRTWTVDTTPPPDTSITAGPSGTTDATGANFEFESTEDGSTFECRLDTGAFGPCSSPKAYAGLADGTHTFEVRATDTAANTDASAASRTWTIDTSAPDTLITSGPSGTTNQGSATFEFTSDVSGATFECKLDTDPFAACASPQPYSSIGDGEHTFQVRAIDGLSHSDPTPATRTWTVDTTPPDTSITAGPSSSTDQTSATFAFSSSEAGATFTCSLDGGPFAACTSPRGLTGLAAGAHTFQVRATDAAGNTDASPASRSWTITTPAPPPAATSTPPPYALPAPTATVDATAPTVRILIAKRALKIKIVLRKGLRFKVRCNEPCSSSAQLVLAKKLAKKLHLPVIVATGRGTTSFRLNLTRAAKRAFARLRKVKVTLRLTTSDKAGNKRRTKKPLVLKR